MERTYHEPDGKAIRPVSPRFDGTTFLMARSVRFKLDEAGATLTSESIFAGAGGLAAMRREEPFSEGLP